MGATQLDILLRLVAQMIDRRLITRTAPGSGGETTLRKTPMVQASEVQSELGLETLADRVVTRATQTQAVVPLVSTGSLAPTSRK
jgi:hypothetical protein